MKKLTPYLLFLAFALIYTSQTNAQQVGDIFYNRIDSVKISENNQEFLMPWIGGLNAVQFNEMDLNEDGIMDLVIFDKTTKKILTFLNNGTPNTVSYTYAPQYRKAFPEVIHWMLTRDYNCNGKMDIFVGVNGGMAVYKNTSANNILSFEVETELLYHRNCFNSFEPNLYINSSDIPAIVDLDGDGDLDIVTFGAFFNESYLYINESVENYGTCDSLDFNFVNCAYGNFSVGLLPGQFTLNQNCYQFNCKKNLAPVVDFPFVENVDDIKAIQHAGSTLLVEDFNGDGKKDVLIAHVEGRGMSLLINGGSSSLDADVTTVINNFPTNDQKIDMYLFPAAFYLDVDNDGIKDIIASPNAPFTSQNANSVHFYKNFNANDSGLFKFQQDDFFQEWMIELGEGAYPVLVDFDQDGDLDLFVGNFGYYDSSVFANSFYTGKIAFFENIGTSSSPEFDLKSRDFANFSVHNERNVVPTFGDIDGDGDIDMLVAVREGKVYFYENTAGAGNTPTYSLQSNNYQNLNLGFFPAMQLFDVDGDGLLDMLYGNRNGRLLFIKNTGTATNPDFSSAAVTNFGAVDVRNMFYNLGYSYPFMYENNDGKLELMVGSENGKIYLYDNIIDSVSGNINTAFNLVSDSMANIFEGIRSGITGGSLFDDGFMDLIVGSYSGGVVLFKGWDTLASDTIVPPIDTINTTFKSFNEIEFNIFPNPTKDFVQVEIINHQNTSLNYQLVDLSGRVIKEGLLQNQRNQISLDDTAKGVYILKVFNNNAMAGFKKLIRQ